MTLARSTQLFRDIAFDIDLPNVCNQFSALRCYAGIVDLTLTCAARRDPQGRALHFYKNGEPQDDSHGIAAYNNRWVGAGGGDGAYWGSCEGGGSCLCLSICVCLYMQLCVGGVHLCNCTLCLCLCKFVCLYVRVRLCLPVFARVRPCMPVFAATGWTVTSASRRPLTTCCPSASLIPTPPACPSLRALPPSPTPTG